MSGNESVSVLRLTQVVDSNGIVSVEMTTPSHLEEETEEEDIKTETRGNKKCGCCCPERDTLGGHWRWKCGPSARTWAKIITAKEMGIRTFGLIMFSSLCYDVCKIIMTLTDNTDLLFQIFLLGGVLWNFLLLLFWSTSVGGTEPGAIMKFRIWFIYTLVCYILFVSIIFYLLFRSPPENCVEYRLCTLHPHIYLWLIILIFSFTSLCTAFGALAILAMILDEILKYRANRRERLLSPAVDL